MEREYKRTPDWPVITTPLTGNELAEIWQDGEQRQGPLSVLGGVPSAHAESHKFGGSDVLGTQDKTANAIPITDGSGTLDVFVSDSSTTVKGKVQLATDGESAANKATQSNDARLSNARTPTAHAGSHLGGIDDLGLGTAAFLDSGVANGVAPLNSSGQVDSAFLPSYVDDVIEVANYSALPVTGETGKIYVTLDTNLTYRWSGSAYVEISKSLALGETSSTAYRGDRGKTAYDHSQVTGNPHGTAIADISTLAGKITPLSDLSRVMRINGDGVPMIPDDSGGAIFQDFSSGWYLTQCALTTVGGITTIVTTGHDPYIYKEFSFAGNANRFIRLIFDSPIDFQFDIYYTTSSHAFDWHYAKMVSAVVGRNVIDVDMGYLSAGGNDWIDSAITCVRFDFGTEAGQTFKIYGAYLGNLAYSTPVYGKDGQTVAVNHGVVPVNGKRGKGLLFQGKGAMPLVFNGPVIGPTGTIRFKFKTSNTLIGGFYFGNAASSAGLALYQNDGGATDLKGFSIGGLAINTEYTFSFYFSLTNLYVYRNGSLLFTYTLTTPLIVSPNNLYIGTNAESPDGQNFTLYDFEYVAEPETLDAHIRFMNGDDAVDSQQKSPTPVPHSIMTRKSDGRTEVATGTATTDAINKGQLDTAISNILYETYTAASTFAAGQLGYLNSSGQVALFDANAEATSKGALYIALSGITSGSSGLFQRMGEYTTTGLTAGATYYGSETPGGITTTAPTTSGAIVRIIGYAQSTTVLMFQPSNDYVVLA